MALEDLNNWFENIRTPAEGVDPDTIINNITQVYQDDLSIRDAAVQETETALTAAQEQIRDLQVKNYKLLVGQSSGSVPGDGGNNNQQDSEQERAATVTFSDIFKK